MCLSQGRIWMSINMCCRYGWLMAFNAAFNSISVIPGWSVLLVEEAGVPSR